MSNVEVQKKKKKKTFLKSQMRAQTTVSILAQNSIIHIFLKVGSGFDNKNADFLIGHDVRINALHSNPNGIGWLLALSIHIMSIPVQSRA